MSFARWCLLRLEQEWSSTNTRQHLLGEVLNSDLVKENFLGISSAPLRQSTSGSGRLIQLCKWTSQRLIELGIETRTIELSGPNAKLDSGAAPAAQTDLPFKGGSLLREAKPALPHHD